MAKQEYEFTLILSGVSEMNSARSTGHRRRSSFPSPRRERDSPTYRAGRLAPEL